MAFFSIFSRNFLFFVGFEKAFIGDSCAIAQILISENHWVLPRRNKDAKGAKHGAADLFMKGARGLRG